MYLNTMITTPSSISQPLCIHLMLPYTAIATLRDANMPIIGSGKSNRRKKDAGVRASYMGVKAAVFKIYSYLRRDNGSLSRNLEQ